MPEPVAAATLDIPGRVRELFTYHFMVNALAAGTAVAVMAAIVGWFVVVRRQVFAGHTLSLVAFPGAAGAALAGLPAASGYYAACGLGAVALAPASRSGPSRGAETAAIGTVQAFALGCGFLFASLYHGLLGGVAALLFGSFVGIDDGQVLTLFAVAALAIALIGIAGRPLLFASLDPEGAAAAGVPVRALGAAFLLLLALAVAATAQITGALLVFTLLVTPAATAQALTSRPVAGMLVAVALALIVTWLGLAFAYFSPWPVGFWITSLSFGFFVLARVWRARRARSACGTSPTRRLMLPPGPPKRRRRRTREGGA
ncbi:MAG: metal ABC transporter permease [Actinobacteria bacterium]|nr:metal ABC transporter permease [Actinomycetota bacterium]